MAYRLAFMASLRHMHDVFHVYILRHYISHHSHVRHDLFTGVVRGWSHGRANPHS
jgi:hypothetical protein